MTKGPSLNLPNALMVIKGPSNLSVMDSDAEDLGYYGESVNRDWRRLRDRLPNLFLGENYDPSAVARWLNDAGYIAKSGTAYAAFTAELVAGKIEQLVFEWARLVSWGMQTFKVSKRRQRRPPVSVSEQRKLLRRYSKNLQNAGRRGYSAPPIQPLLTDLGGAPDFDFHLLELFVLGIGSTRPLPATFSLDGSARPIVEIQTESPMHAITLAVFIDRVFTHRKLAICKFCGHKFMSRSETQMFCPGTGDGVTHQSRWQTKFRRERVKAVKAALNAVGPKFKLAAALATKTVQKKYPKEPPEKILISPKWAKQEAMKERKRNEQKRQQKAVGSF